MISAAYVRAMAEYNRWMNVNLYDCAASLSDADRRRDLGAFFGSIHGTLNHILWGDRAWMYRLAWGRPPPAVAIADSVALFDAFEALRHERIDFDAQIIDWAAGISETALQGDLTYFSAAAGCEFTRPRWQLVAHMFNHQTHHRGQVHSLLTRCGARPGDTDLHLLPVGASGRPEEA